MHNCSIHASPEVLKILKEHDVKVITFPPHTTQISQPLDVSRFSPLKKKSQEKLPLGNEDLVAALIQKVFNSLKQTFIANDVRNAFKMLGVK
jgi:hypothetical protein